MDVARYDDEELTSFNRVFSDDEAAMIRKYQRDNEISIDRMSDSQVDYLYSQVDNKSGRLWGLDTKHFRSLLGRERRHNIKRVGNAPYLNANEKVRGRGNAKDS